MLSWAIGFFLAACLAAYVAFQAGGSFPDVVQLLFWVVTPILTLTLLRPLFHRKPAPLPALPRNPAMRARRRDPINAPPLPYRPRAGRKLHSLGSRSAAFLVNAGIAMLLFTWANNELKAQRDMDAYASNPPPFMESVTLTGASFDAGR